VTEKDKREGKGEERKNKKGRGYITLMRRGRGRLELVARNIPPLPFYPHPWSASLSS
jgi:hypothetical protein